MAEYKKAGSCRALIVTGCMAQRYQQEILDEIPEVDAVLGTMSYEKIADALETVLKGERKLEAASLTYLPMPEEKGWLPPAGIMHI